MGVSASSSVLPMNIQDRFPLGWTGWISMQSKGFSRVFSNTTVKKHQFFGAQISQEILNDKMLQRPGQIWQVCSMMTNERYVLAAQIVCVSVKTTSYEPLRSLSPIHDQIPGSHQQQPLTYCFKISAQVAPSGKPQYFSEGAFIYSSRDSLYFCRAENINS